MATARLRRPSAPAERLIAEVLRAQGEFFEAIRRPSEEFLARAIDLPATFDPLDAETIREAQLAYQRAFQQRSSERLRLGVRKAMREPTRQTLIRDLRKQQRETDDPDVKVRLEQQVERVRREPDPRRQAVSNLLETERRLARAHAAAMAGRAREASRSVQVRAESPTGAMWRRDPASNSCDECRFLDGKLLPWEVIEQISPPRHPNCRCTLIPLGAARAQGWIRPNAKVPSVRQAIHRYRRLLQETIEGAILVEAERRGLFREVDVERDRLGRFDDEPGASVGKRARSLEEDLAAFWSTWSYEGVRTEVKVDKANNGATVIKGNFIDPRGEKVGEFTRQYAVRGTIYHNELVTSRNAPPGLGTQFHRDSMERYVADDRLDTVALRAGYAAGGYVWAREGVKAVGDTHGRGEWALISRHIWASRILEVEAAMRTRGMFDDPRAQAAYDELYERTKAGQFDSVQEIAAFGREHTWVYDRDGVEHVMWPGKSLLSGAEYDAQFDVRSEAQRAASVASQRTPEAQAEIDRMLGIAEALAPMALWDLSRAMGLHLPPDPPDADDRMFWDRVAGLALAEDYNRGQWRDRLGRWRDMPGPSIGRWREKTGKPRLELKEPMEGTSFASVGRKKLTKTQVHARAKQVARAMADFYGDDDPPEVYREDQYLADVGSDARFRHKGETLAGLLYGYRVARDAADPDAGVHPFRMIAHEAAHSLSGAKPGPLPGFSQTVEEGGAEILSLWFWKHRGQEMDHRDATKAEGKWTEGVRTLVHSSVYRGEITEMIRRSASLVGWDREAIIDEVEAAMRSDHSGRLRFRDATREDEPSPPGVEDTPEGIIEWLLADEPVTLKGNWALSPTAEAEVRQTIGDLLMRYPVPFRHVETAEWVDEIGQYAGKSNDTIHVSPKFLDDEAAAAREREWRGISKAGENGRPGTIVHEFGHIIDGVLLREDRGAYEEIRAFLAEPVRSVGDELVPRVKAGLEAPSPYGGENEYEFVAEAFTDWYFNGAEAHPSSQAIGAIIDRAFGSRMQEAWGSTQARARQAADQLRVGTGNEGGGRFTAKVVPAIGSGDRATGAAAVGKSDLGDGSDLFRDDGKTIFGHTIPPGLRLATPEERRQSRVPPGYPLAYVPEDRAEMENGIVGVGVDKMGRVKRFYSDSAMAKRAQQKFERIRLLTPKLDRLDADLVRDATEDDAAAAALLVRITGMRPGSERKTGGAQEAFGATTLQARHVEIEGDTVTFDFVGKNGKRVQFPVSNAVLAGALTTRLEGKGPEEQLFPAVNENALNAWLKQALGGREYKTKDLRTALATATAQARVNELTPDGVPPGKAARQKLRKEIATEISERLGNTPAEVIKSYVDPGVWNALGL